MYGQPIEDHIVPASACSAVLHTAVRSCERNSLLRICPGFKSCASSSTISDGAAGVGLGSTVSIDDSLAFVCTTGLPPSSPNNAWLPAPCCSLSNGASSSTSAGCAGARSAGLSDDFSRALRIRSLLLRLVWLNELIEFVD